VFALLGLAYNKMSLEADYQKSVVQVYVDNALAFLAGGDVLILSVPRPISSRINLSSWVLDWAAIPNLALTWNRFRSSNNTMLRTETHGYSGGLRTILSLEGTKLCSVSKASVGY
jgi:hypothetical protein